MQIIYHDKKIEKICTDASVAVKKYSKPMASKIFLRISQISAITNVEELVEYNVGRCHSLKGQREGQYAMDLVHPFRLVFTVNEKEIQIACIEEIVDYH